VKVSMAAMAIGDQCAVTGPGVASFRIADHRSLITDCHLHIQPTTVGIACSVR